MSDGDFVSFMPSFKSFKTERAGESVQILAGKNDSERSLPNPGNLESQDAQMVCGL